jgi:predicted nucleic acid-binding protein
LSTDRYLLDTSALISLVEGEEGTERIEQILRLEECLLPWTVLLEAAYITRQEQGEAESDYRYAMMKQLPARILWEMDEPVLLTAARFKANFRISFADAVIAAYAVQENAILLHKDPEFEQLDGQVRLETLPYK